MSITIKKIFSDFMISEVINAIINFPFFVKLALEIAFGKKQIYQVEIFIKINVQMQKINQSELYGLSAIIGTYINLF